METSIDLALHVRSRSVLRNLEISNFKPYVEKSTVCSWPSAWLRDRVKASYSEKQEYETETDGIEMELNMTEPLEGKVSSQLGVQDCWGVRPKGCIPYLGFAQGEIPNAFSSLYPMQSSIVLFDSHFLSWQVEEATMMLPRTPLCHLRFRRI